jgi:hypothetical protein
MTRTGVKHVNDIVMYYTVDKVTIINGYIVIEQQCNAINAL